ncbi:MAG: helix-turn-helix transcriptional regulator [Clostridia bacterium]|nr:helix-turn-helix transcriptional regulator [Clostridia bacterium]
MFNRNLKEIRLQKGLTQREVAAFLHISPQSISKWENGEATPSIEFLPLLAKLFDCKTDDFFESKNETSATLEALEKFAEFCRIFNCDKDTAEYVGPAEYMEKNSGWEESCISFFESMRNEKCFTVQTLQSHQNCDFETAQKICKALESMGCLTKAPDSKYYVTNAENMGDFISMIKLAKAFSKIRRAKDMNELRAWLDKKN